MATWPSARSSTPAPTSRPPAASRGLPLEPFDLDVEQIEQRGLRATQVNVRTSSVGLIRTYSSIRALLDRQTCRPTPDGIAQRIFRRLAEAEAMVHRRELEQVTFHEVGAVDSIVDIVGTALALSSLGIDRVFASAVPTGLGMTKTEHGVMPIPLPPSSSCSAGAPMYSRNVPVELVDAHRRGDPRALVEGFGELPHMRWSKSATGPAARAWTSPTCSAC